MGLDDDIHKRLDKLEYKIGLAEKYIGHTFWSTLDLLYEMNLPTRRLTCIVCKHSGDRASFEILTDTCVFGGGKLERYKCSQCDCIFGPQKYLDLSESMVDLDYRTLYSNYTEADSTENEIRTFHSMQPDIRGVFLDWGCGGTWSSTVSQLRRDDWDVWGFEPSADISSDFVVNRRGSISAKFNGIFSNNVIEHFRDPVQQFLDFHSLLVDDGLMSHSSPCYEYQYAYTRFHTLFLVGRSPFILAQRTGFEVIDFVKEGEYINYTFKKIQPAVAF